MKKQFLAIALMVSLIATNAYAGYAFVRNMTDSNCDVTLHNGLNGDMNWSHEYVAANGKEVTIGDYGAGIKEIHAVCLDGALKNQENLLTVRIPAGSNANNVRIKTDDNGKLKLSING
jgi:hypothetical protein